MYKGYERRVVREILEPARVIAYTTYATAHTGKKRPKPMKQWWSLPGEKPSFDIKEMKSAFQQALKKNSNNERDSKGNN